MKKDEEIIEPELNITDDMPEPEQKPAAESIEATPTIETEKEPATEPQYIAVKDSSRVSFKQRLQAFFATRKGKITAIIAGILLIIGVLLAIPFTRYALLGIFIKKDVTLTVIDQNSKKPVSGATVTLGTQAVSSDAKGVAKLSSVPVGDYELRVEKKYHQSIAERYTVPVLSAPQDIKPELKATGRSVTVTVTNKIGGKPVAGVSLNVSDSTFETDDKGVASIILPVQAAPQKGTAKADGYNDASFEVTVSNADDQKLAVQLTPKGAIYFLSKRTGNINVMKSNLDGSNASVVVEGTGKESDGETVLLASRDWKYLALLAKRDSDKAKLYLIKTDSGELSTMDEGDATFDLIGWSGSRFVYRVNREKQVWEDKGYALKSYYAANGERKTLDETAGYGTAYNNFGSEYLTSAYIIDNQVVYGKYWSFGGPQDITGKKRSIIAINSDGSNKKTAKEFDQPVNGFIEARAYEPGGIYFRVSENDGKANFYEYEDGKVAAVADTNDAKFYGGYYATYLVSPDGNRTFWYEPRDGKNVIFVGDASGNNGREIGVSDFVPYGWYTDSYLLFSKNNSELYVLSETGTISETSKPSKITDYHKPALSYPGYGYGYGGQ